MAFDLLSTVESGGCSAKLSPKQLSEILSNIPIVQNANILVDIQTHDDAGVYKLNDDTALIVTTDFFPPVCSDAFEFGQIAAANALSDVYAMGGDALLALNLMMFPSTQIPLEEFGRILAGGQQKIAEAGAFVMGGHTINDNPPKYGLAVVGIVHPSKLMTNAGAREGQKLILTKPLGTGILVAAQRVGLAQTETYRAALDTMKTLNKSGKDIMQKYGVKGATDITGFGLAGHAMQMAKASGVSFRIITKTLPKLPQAMQLIEDGCVPGATYRNLDYVKGRVHFGATVDMAHQSLCADAQTSGGLFFAVDALFANQAIADLHELGLHDAAIIGEVLPRGSKEVYFE
jgi:selenide,water dikinase